MSGEYILESDVRPESITFMAKKEKQQSYFDVWNRGQMHQIYKIKTTNTKGYKIKPPLFSIGVNERMRVFINYQGVSDKPAKDRISVVFAHHVNIKNTVEQAWNSVKQMVNTPEKRAYVAIVFKEEQRRSIAEVKEEVQRSVMLNKSITARPQSLGSSRLEPSSSAGRDNDPFVPSPKKAKTPLRKRTSDPSNCSTEPSEGTTEEVNTKGSSKSKKRGVSQTADATEEDPPVPHPKPRSRRKVAAVPTAEATEEDPPAPPVKPRSRRKVATPPPDEEDEEPPSPVKAVVPRRKKSARAAAAVAAETTEDEVAEVPVAPKKTRKPVQQVEEEEEEAPPPPKGKPRSRRKVQTPRVPVNEEDDETRLGGGKIISVSSPVRTPRKVTSKPKTLRKSSGSIDPLEAIVGDSKVVYVIQKGNNEEEEESDRKTRKKSKDSKKSSKKRRKEEEEEEEEEED